MQFDRLEPAELISLLLAAIAGGSLYAIVVTSLAPKLAMAPNTRVALAMVARGEALLGIVYTTDANGARYCGDRRPRCIENLNVLRSGPSAAAEVSPSVKIIGTFPADSHPAIVYPVAATLTAKPEAVGYLAYLRSMTAKAIFEQYGFTFLIQPTS
jgi:molybdate transport system substrate-binding protein